MLSVSVINIGSKNDVLTDKIRVLALDVHSKGNEYGIEKWLAPTGQNRVLALVFSLSVLNMDSKHDLRQLMKSPSTFSLSLLNMSSNQDLRQLMKLIGFRYLSYLRWIWNRKMICATWLNSCIVAIHSAHLTQIWARNLTRAGRRNSCICAWHSV